MRHAIWKWIVAADDWVLEWTLDVLAAVVGAVVLIESARKLVAFAIGN
jgi:hypothetical protein